MFAGDRCLSLTNTISNCYNKPLVYNECCESCDNAILPYLPANCSWGNQYSWCVGVTESQCSDPDISGESSPIPFAVFISFC